MQEVRAAPDGVQTALVEHFREKLDGDELPAEEMNDDDVIRTVLPRLDGEERRLVLRILRSLDDK